jgi:hypothetical protein
MIDITAPKVLIPTALFALLSPGMLVQLPDKLPGSPGWFNSMDMSNMSTLFHMLIFVIVYSLIARAMNIVLTKTDLLVTALLFVVLTPGLLLTLPPGSSGVFASGQTGIAPVLVHAFVFAVVFALLRKQFPKFY